jgi:hypothetical protein
MKLIENQSMVVDATASIVVIVDAYSARKAEIRGGYVSRSGLTAKPRFVEEGAIPCFTQGRMARELAKRYKRGESMEGIFLITPYGVDPREGEYDSAWMLSLSEDLAREAIDRLVRWRLQGWDLRKLPEEIHFILKKASLFFLLQEKKDNFSLTEAEVFDTLSNLKKEGIKSYLEVTEDLTELRMVSQEGDLAVARKEGKSSFRLNKEAYEVISV